jgi:hypothetical protein
LSFAFKENAMNENPETPGTDSPAAIYLTDTALRFLKQTKPWTRFMSIMIFISSAFMVLAGLAVSILGFGLQAIQQNAAASGALTIMRALAGIIYFLIGSLYIAPGVFLWKFSDAINLLEMSHSQQSLEDALKNQKSFWRYVGIMTIIAIAAAFIFIAFSIIIAIFLVRKNMMS